MTESIRSPTPIFLFVSRPKPPSVIGVTGDTMILTSEGLKDVSSLVGKRFTAIVEGKEFQSDPRGFILQGKSKVSKITLDNGLFLKASTSQQVGCESGWISNDKLLSTDNLLIPDNYPYKWKNNNGTPHEGYFCGQLIGDGTFTTADKPVISLWVHPTCDITKHPPAMFITELVKTLKKRPDFKGFCKEAATDVYIKYRVICAAFREIVERFGIKRLEKKVPENGSYEFTAKLLQGFFDADGSIQGTQEKGVSIRLAQVDISRLEAVQRLLFGMGIYSKLYKNRSPAEERYLPDGKGDVKLYHCQSFHELIITKSEIVKYASLIGFLEPAKDKRTKELLGGYARRINKTDFISKIVSIEPQLMEEEVYSCSIIGAGEYSANGIRIRDNQLLNQYSSRILKPLSNVELIDISTPDANKCIKCRRVIVNIDYSKEYSSKFSDEFKSNIKCIACENSSTRWKIKPEFDQFWSDYKSIGLNEMAKKYGVGSTTVGRWKSKYEEVA